MPIVAGGRKPTDSFARHAAGGDAPVRHMRLSSDHLRDGEANSEANGKGPGACADHYSCQVVDVDHRLTNKKTGAAWGQGGAKIPQAPPSTRHYHGRARYVNFGHLPELLPRARHTLG